MALTPEETQKSIFIITEDNAKRRLRTLKQFKGMTDEEFNLYYEKMTLDAAPTKEFEARIAGKWAELEADYDFSDMKVNDKATIRALCQALITLDDLEQMTYNLRKEGISPANINVVEKTGELMSRLRNDISNMQDDLKITRKIRKGDKELSVVSYLADLTAKAKKDLKAKQFYIFCPKCNMLLGTVWSHYPEENRNKIAFICHRKTGEGDEECGHKVIVSTKELLDAGGSNKIELMPEAMR